MSKLITTEMFLNRIKHKSDYHLMDFSQTKYRGQHNNVTFKCPHHGDIVVHAKTLYNSTICCGLCSNSKHRQTMTMVFSDFTTRSNLIHNNKYSYLEDGFGGSHHKTTIVCPEHGVFSQTPKDHLRGRGCPKCKIDLAKKRYSSSKQEFINKSVKKHGNLYSYTNVIYTNSGVPVSITCHKHGDFLIIPESHTSNSKAGGCPKCKSSRGETLIRSKLSTMGVLFKEQYRFSDCKNKRPLPFDFAIIDSKQKVLGLIEYDGEQHFMPGKFNGVIVNKQEYINKNDLIKSDYCSFNSIPLLRVAFFELSGLDCSLPPFITRLR